MRHLIAALLLAVLSATAGAAETVSPDEMRALAVEAIARGRPDLAGGMTDALLDRDPNDVTALLIRSRALRDLGRYDAAIEAARAAWRAGETDGERYRAALLRAQALSSAGNRTWAQLWLRRATTLAPTERARAVAIRDFRHVRRRNPLKVQLSFNISPTSNVNNGATEEIATLFGLPFRLSGDALALSGLRFAGGAQLRYRLGGTETTRDTAEFSLFHQTYRLSSEAREIAPEAEGSDYAYTAISAGWSRLYSPGPGRGLYEFGAIVGTSWYGGEPLAHFVRLEGERRLALSRALTARLGARIGIEKRATGGNPVVREIGIKGGLTRRLASGGSVELGLGAEFSDSEAVSHDYRSAEATLGYTLGEPVAGARLTLTAGIELTDFAATPYKAGGRRDLTQRLAAEMVFPEMEYYGFAPTLTVEGSWRDSNVDLFESETVGIRLGFESVF